ncbi:MAG: mandelate racemase/muconate lactonizing enzyme family protein [Dethiobacteria bacterium]
MKITGIKAEFIQLPYSKPFKPTWYPGREEKKQGIFLVRVYTDEGITGIATAEAPFGLAPVFIETIKHLIEPAILNDNPFMVEKIIWKLRDVARVVTRPWVVENALWDIIGKASNQPVYKILGGFRDKMPVYAAWGELKPNEQRYEDAQMLVEQGFKAVKVRFCSDTIKDDLSLIETIRKAVGDKLQIMIDANQGTARERSGIVGETSIWSYERAYQTAKALEEYDVSWLEEPLYRYDYKLLAKLAAEVDLPIAGGEINRDVPEFAMLIERDCYDILQPNCTMAAGMSQVKKIAAIAENHGKLCNLHSWIPSVGLIASLHLAASLSNSTHLEYPYDPPVITPEVFQGAITEPLLIDPADGCLPLPQKPGFGVELDEELIKKYTVLSSN